MSLTLASAGERNPSFTRQLFNTLEIHCHALNMFHYSFMAVQDMFQYNHSPGQLKVRPSPIVAFADSLQVRRDLADGVLPLRYIGPVPKPAKASRS